MTERAEDSAVYWDALLDYDVDLVVREPGQSVGRDIALSIRAWSRSLYGDGQTREEVLAYMAVPTYEEARKLLTLADENLALAQQAEDEFFRDQRYRGAFDTLFNAARYAAMTLRAEPQGEAFLHTEEIGGRVRRQLPSPFETRFRDFIDTLHVHWRQAVGRFIDDLEHSSGGGKSD
nr:hypothetical protein [Anaerolineae bacterium]